VYDVFVARLSARVKDLAVGPGVTPGVEQGPLIDEAAVSKVSGLLADAVASGAEVTVGGERHALGGTFFAPTVLAGVRPDMAIAREEIFGPVAAVYRFETEAEAVALANDTEYGLAAYFYARDLSRVWRVARQLDYGMVGINSGLISTAVAPFGGVKQSGYGREGSRQGIEEYMQTKYLCMNVG